MQNTNKELIEALSANLQRLIKIINNNGFDWDAKHGADMDIDVVRESNNISDMDIIR